MAYRAAATLDRPVAGVIACGGDVPPELGTTALAAFRPSWLAEVPVTSGTPQKRWHLTKAAFRWPE